MSEYIDYGWTDEVIYGDGSVVDRLTDHGYDIYDTFASIMRIARIGKWI